MKSDQMIAWILFKHRALDEADVTQVGEEAALEPTVPEQQQVELKVDVPQKQAEISQVGEKPSLEPGVLAQQQTEQKLDVPRKPVSPVAKEPLLKPAVSEQGFQEPQLKTIVEPTSQPKEKVDIVPPLPKHDERTANTVDSILESEIVKNCAAPSSQTTENAKPGLQRKAESHILIIGG